ncbi:MAG TPA: DUF1566 domain-containing protein [Steroidobacteraceae bacterium]|jgi:hypothetical protein
MVHKALVQTLLLVSTLVLAIAAGAACDSSQPTQTPTSRYVVKGGEVYDSKTDLTWQRCSFGQQWKADNGCVGVIRQMTWSDAIAKASGHWRLPTKDELSTLISPTCKDPAINEAAFPDMELLKLWYWTSSENGATAWYVAFGGGTVRSGGPTDLDSVRLVRRGK